MAPNQAQVVLSVEDASRRYEDRKALDGVSLRVHAGEIYALIGRNGAGKSSLAKAVAGALQLDHGEVRVLGADMARARTTRRLVGVAPQDIALWGHLTVRENISAFAALAGVPRALRAEATVRAMTDSGCGARADGRVDQLSGGWRRRANLAAAIVHSPRLLILDEPTDGLDLEMKAAFRVFMDRVRASQVAVLLISHDTEDVVHLADRIGVLEQGRLIAEGPPEDLMARAFGGRQQLEIRLDACCAAVESSLGRRGLEAAADGLTWRALVSDAWGQAREIDQSLRSVGVGGLEVRVRNPGLDALIAWAAEQRQA